MPTIRTSTTVAVPPERLWDSLSDISSHVEWMADAEAIRFTSERREGVGTTFDCDTKVGPFRLVDRMEVTAWEPGRRMGVRHVGLVSGAGEFTLSPAGDGTEFAWTETLRFPWWLGGPVGAAVASPVLRLIWRGNLRRLRERVEGAPGDA